METTGNSHSMLTTVNCDQIRLDLVALTSIIRDSNADPRIRGSLARVGIVQLAFYVEALANLVLNQSSPPVKSECPGTDEYSLFDNRSDLPKPIRKLRAYYKREFNRDLPLGIKEVKDLFLIRNQLFAHPPGRTVVKSTDQDELRPLHYDSFKDFPFVYREFEIHHFEKLLKAVKDFLSIYWSLADDKLEAGSHSKGMRIEFEMVGL